MSDYVGLSELQLRFRYWDPNPGDDFDWYVQIDNVAVTGQPVPEPATMLLLGSGLVGLAAFSRKKFFKRT